MSSSQSRWLAALLGLLVAAAGLRAEAYVRTVTHKSGTPLRWMHSNCVMMRINAKGSKDLPGEQSAAVARQAMANWWQATSGCSYMGWALQIPDSPTAVAGFNKDGPNENVIVWVEEGWSHGFQVALTTVSFVDKPGSPSDGQILDTDIEVNGETYDFASPTQFGFDMETVITHELGHVLGLEHTCGKPGAKDDLGNPVPVCGPGMDPSIRETTMYPNVEPGETFQRTPSADDVAGVCAIYPRAEDPGQCVAAKWVPVEGGCALAGQRPASSGWPLFALPLLLLWWLGPTPAADQLNCR